jgi:4'-phosphopantetheinyl transferase EntD
MLANIILPGVKVTEQLNDDPTASLLPGEKAALGRVSAIRRHEFTQARRCAHRALIELGFPAAPIVRGAHHEPIWPNGIVGSITHCRGYIAAAVARHGELI